jgi:hypothetical protein
MRRQRDDIPKPGRTPHTSAESRGKQAAFEPPVREEDWDEAAQDARRGRKPSRQDGAAL